MLLEFYKRSFFTLSLENFVVIALISNLKKTPIHNYSFIKIKELFIIDLYLAIKRISPSKR